jgi:hypothetical protein
VFALGSVIAAPHCITQMNLLDFRFTNGLQSLETIPGTYRLGQNYPNPFNPVTHIEFQIPESEFVSIKIFNLIGKEVATLVSEEMNPGNYRYRFDGKALASGVYYYQLVAGEFREVKKMILLR